MRRTPEDICSSTAVLLQVLEESQFKIGLLVLFTTS